MGRLLDQWKATLSTLTSIEVLALLVLGLIGPVQRDSPQWLLSAAVVVAGLIVPALLIGVVFVGVATRALQRRRGDR
jgi:hypothetical protein